MTDALARLFTAQVTLHRATELELQAILYGLTDYVAQVTVWGIIAVLLLLLPAFLGGWLFGSRDARTRIHATKLWKLVGELRARLERAEADNRWLAEECERLARERLRAVVEQVHDPHHLGEIRRRRTG